MKSAHNLTLILPEGMDLDTFEQIVNGAFGSSDYQYEKYSWHPITPMKEVKVVYNSKDFKLEAIPGRDLAFELSCNKQEIKTTVYMVEFSIGDKIGYSGPYSVIHRAKLELERLQRWSKRNGLTWDYGEIIEKELE